MVLDVILRYCYEGLAGGLPGDTMGLEFSPVSAIGIILDGDQCHVFTAEGGWPVSDQ